MAGVLHAFTGQNAFFGLNAQNACRAAAHEINAAGGTIMGHPLSCANFDTKGDPADAVPVTNRMLVSAPHLTRVVGPDGSDIPSVPPLLEQAKVPEMNTVGDPRYDKQTSPYFWRLTPSDSTQAPALAYYAYHRGFTKVAEIFTSDLSAETTTAPFQATYARLGGTIVKKLTIAPDQESYQTEVAQALAAHPQALVGEMDARTAATFLSELRQQHGCWPSWPTWVKNTGSEVRQFSSISVGRCMTPPSTPCTARCPGSSGGRRPSARSAPRSRRSPPPRY